MKLKKLKILISSGAEGQLGSSIKLYLNKKHLKNKNDKLNFFFFK